MSPDPVREEEPPPWAAAVEAYKRSNPRKAMAVDRAYAGFDPGSLDEEPAQPTPEAAAPEELPLDAALPPPTLTLEEKREAYAIGVKRFNAARERGAHQRFGWLPTARQRLETDGESAVAEATVARYLGREWLSTGGMPDDPAVGDVDGGVSVRWTPRETGSLIIHEDEVGELYAVLVVGTSPEQKLVGWLIVEECWQPRFWRTEGVRHPAFFVPQSFLRPMSELRALMA